MGTIKAVDLDFGVIKCLTEREIISNGGYLITNPDGSVSVFNNDPRTGLYPVQLNLYCCKALNDNFYFDINTQTCRWAEPQLCSFGEPINLIVNPKGNDGSLFYVDVEDNETCSLKISFDYLLKVKCEDLSRLSTPTKNLLTKESNRQINETNLEIGGITVDIENLSNQIFNLNEEWTNTPYSIHCDTYVLNQIKKETINVVSNDLKVVSDTLCYAYSFYSVVGGTIFWTDCDGNQKSVFINTNSTYLIPCAKVGSVIGDGTITMLEACNTTSKFTAFDNSGFNKPETGLNLDINSQELPSIINYTMVNLCLTEYGLQIWASILGPINYQQFIIGNENSYTCDNIYTLVNQTWPNGQVVDNCDIPFGTKSNLLTEINKLMVDLVNLNESLTQKQGTLINIQDNLTNVLDGGKCRTPIEAFEALDIEMHLDVVGDNNTLTSVSGYTLFPAIGAGNLYNYLSTSGDSGFYVCGDPNINDVGLSECTPLSLNTGIVEIPNVSSCNLLINGLMGDLLVESTLNSLDELSQNITDSAFASNWLSYSTTITDPIAIAQIANKKIKLSFKIKYSCVDFCLLLDNLVLDKSCTTISKTEIIIPKSPGFDFKRVIDNKKSWVDTTTTTNREFHIGKFDDSNSIRQTNYSLNDERLILNTKEIDLDISVASAIETDVWCFLNDNPNLLSGSTGSTCTGNTCGDNFNINALATQAISGVTTIEGFETLIISEFIDVKNRQTISSYATLRAIYERYLNSGAYVGNISSAFNYQNMDKFAGLIGNYWIDLIEQVVPSTTIWGSVKIHTNTIFDEQKFKYKAYSTFLCNKPINNGYVLSPINGVNGEVAYPNVVYKTLAPSNTSVRPKVFKCNEVHIVQMNSGSEFISFIDVVTPVIVYPNITGTTSDTTICVDCTDKSIDFTNTGVALNNMVINQNGDKMFVGDYSGSVLVIDTLTDTLITAIGIGGSGVVKLIYSPFNDSVYVICFITNDVYVINATTNNIVGAPIPIGIGSENGIYVPSNNSIYISNSMSNTVNVINTANNTVTTLTVGNNPRELIYNSDLGLIYVLNELNGTKTDIKVSDNTVSAPTAIGSSNTTFIGVSVLYNQRLYVYNRVDSELYIINTNNGNIINNVPMSGIRSIDYNPSKKFLYLTTDNDSTIIFNTLNDTIVTTTPVSGKQSIYVSSDNNMYVLSGGETLTTIDGSNSGVRVRTIPSKAVYGLYNPTNDSMYISNDKLITIFKCLNIVKSSEIQACDLGVTIESTESNGETLLTAITVGGTSPLQFLWSNGETTQTIVSGNQGYRVTVSDANCCFASTTTSTTIFS
tara:strand:- start:46472 stop:50407 length:3936 start_codon:yes stop_codon:yes gene_type:complete